jgi:hypothetical protein
MPNFKGSDLGRFPLVSADFWTSDHFLERSRSVDAFSGTRARGTLALKRTRISLFPPRRRSGGALAGLGEAATAAERAAVEELRRVVAGDASHARWLEDGELLRFVRARKTLEQRSDLFREAADWRRQRRNKDGAYAESAQGSFGGDEQAWVDGAAAPPDWWAFMTENLPFELFGADANGIPVTYIGLGRMDLSGICREVGIERLEQKMIMQNDMFIAGQQKRAKFPTSKAPISAVFHSF